MGLNRSIWLDGVTAALASLMETQQSTLNGQSQAAAWAIAGAGAYYWEYSLDQHTWISAPETTLPKTVLKGLTVGQTYWFRVRALTRNGKTDPVTPVDIVVH